jgi:hypothetical protein
MAKRKRKTMKELAKGVRKFLKGKEVNEDNGERFEKAVKTALRPSSK